MARAAENEHLTARRMKKPWWSYTRRLGAPVDGIIRLGEALTPQDENLKPGTRARVLTTTAILIFTRPDRLSSRKWAARGKTVNGQAPGSASRGTRDR